MIMMKVMMLVMLYDVMRVQLITVIYPSVIVYHLIKTKVMMSVIKGSFRASCYKTEYHKRNCGEVVSGVLGKWGGCAIPCSEVLCRETCPSGSSVNTMPSYDDGQELLLCCS